jgi:hypothetical protein
VKISIIEGSLDGKIIKMDDLGIVNQFEDYLLTHRINLNDIDFGNENSKALFFKVDSTESNYSEYCNYGLIILYKPETYEIIELPLEELA